MFLTAGLPLDDIPLRIPIPRRVCRQELYCVACDKTFKARKCLCCGRMQCPACLRTPYEGSPCPACLRPDHLVQESSPLLLSPKPLEHFEERCLCVIQ
jgi:hypothetical protein